MNLLLEGYDLEELLRRAAEAGGRDARIVRAEKIRRGGVLGFFARESFEVAVEISPEQAAAAAATAAAAVPGESFVAALRLAELQDDDPPPPDVPGVAAPPERPAPPPARDVLELAERVNAGERRDTRQAAIQARYGVTPQEFTPPAAADPEVRPFDVPERLNDRGRHAEKLRVSDIEPGRRDRSESAGAPDPTGPTASTPPVPSAAASDFQLPSFNDPRFDRAVEAADLEPVLAPPTGGSAVPFEAAHFETVEFESTDLSHGIVDEYGDEGWDDEQDDVTDDYPGSEVDDLSTLGMGLEHGPEIITDEDHAVLQHLLDAPEHAAPDFGAGPDLAPVPGLPPAHSLSPAPGLAPALAVPSLAPADPSLAPADPVIPQPRAGTAPVGAPAVGRSQNRVGRNRPDGHRHTQDGDAGSPQDRTAGTMTALHPMTVDEAPDADEAQSPGPVRDSLLAPETFVDEDQHPDYSSMLAEFEDPERDLVDPFLGPVQPVSDARSSSGAGFTSGTGPSSPGPGEEHPEPSPQEEPVDTHQAPAPESATSALAAKRATTIVPARSSKRRAQMPKLPIQRAPRESENAPTGIPAPVAPEALAPEALVPETLPPATDPALEAAGEPSGWRILRHLRGRRRHAADQDRQEVWTPGSTGSPEDGNHWDVEPAAAPDAIVRRGLRAALEARSTPDPLKVRWEATPDPAAPRGAVTGTPARTWDEAPANTWDDAPASTRADAPASTRADAPAGTPAGTRAGAPAGSWAEASAEPLTAPDLAADLGLPPGTRVASFAPPRVTALQSETSLPTTGFTAAAAEGVAAPTGDVIASSEQLARDRAALRRLGVPAAWTRHLQPGDRFTSVLAILDRLPQPAIADDVSVIAVVGPSDVVELEAARTALDLPSENRPRSVVAVPGQAGVDRRSAVARTSRTRPVVVSVATDDLDDTATTRSVLQSVKAEAVIAVVDATRPLDEITRWVEALEQVDAIALDGALDGDHPAAILSLDVPVIRVDGISVDRVGWAALLCAQLAALDPGQPTA